MRFHAFSYKITCLYRLRDMCKYFSSKPTAFNNSENELEKLRFQSFTFKKVVLSVRINLNPNEFIHIALCIQIDSRKYENYSKQLMSKRNHDNFYF